MLGHPKETRKFGSITGIYVDKFKTWAEAYRRVDHFTQQGVKAKAVKWYSWVAVYRLGQLKHQRSTR